MGEYMWQNKIKFEFEYAKLMHRSRSQALQTSDMCHAAVQIVNIWICLL